MCSMHTLWDMISLYKQTNKHFFNTLQRIKTHVKIYLQLLTTLFFCTLSSSFDLICILILMNAFSSKRIMHISTNFATSRENSSCPTETCWKLPIWEKPPHEGSWMYLVWSIMESSSADGSAERPRQPLMKGLDWCCALMCLWQQPKASPLLHPHLAHIRTP